MSAGARAGALIDTDLIPSHTADYLADGLLRGLREWFSIPRNREKFEAWRAEREKAAAPGSTGKAASEKDG